RNYQNDYKIVDYINSSIKFQISFTKITKFEIQIFINEHTNFIIKLFNKFSSSCNSIRHLSIIIYESSYYFHNTLDKAISSLIRSQTSLKSLAINEYSLSYKNTTIYDALLSTHSSSLKYLGFCVMNDYSMLMRILLACEN